MEILNIVCLLLLSGMPKEEFGAEIMQKLRKYNVDLSEMDKMEILCNNTIEGAHGYAKSLRSVTTDTTTTEIAQERDSVQTIITMPRIINREETYGQNSAKDELQINIENKHAKDNKISTVTSLSNKKWTNQKTNSIEVKLTDQIQQIIDKLVFLNATNFPTVKRDESIQKADSKPQTINVFIIQEPQNYKDPPNNYSSSVPYQKTTSGFPYVPKLKPNNEMIFTQTYNDQNDQTNFGEMYRSHSLNTQPFTGAFLSHMQEPNNKGKQNVNLRKLENKVPTGREMIKFTESTVPQAATQDNSNAKYNCILNNNCHIDEDSFVLNISLPLQSTGNPYLDMRSVPLFNSQNGIIKNVNYEMDHNKKFNEYLAYPNPEQEQIAPNIYGYNVPSIKTQREIKTNIFGNVQRNTVPMQLFDGNVNENQYKYMQRATNTHQKSATAIPEPDESNLDPPNKQYRNHQIERDQKRAKSPLVKSAPRDLITYMSKFDNLGSNQHGKRDFPMNPNYYEKSIDDQGNLAAIRNLDPNGAGTIEHDEVNTYPMRAPNIRKYKNSDLPLVMNNGNRRDANSFKNVHVTQDAERNNVHNRQSGSSEIIMDNADNNEQIPRHYPVNHRFTPQFVPMPEPQNLQYKVNSQAVIPKREQKPIFTDNNHQKLLSFINDPIYDSQAIDMSKNSHKYPIISNQENNFKYSSETINITRTDPTHHYVQRSSNENLNSGLTQNEYLRLNRMRKENGRERVNNVHANKSTVDLVQQIKALVIEELNKPSTSKGPFPRHGLKTKSSNEDRPLVTTSTQRSTVSAVNNINLLKENIVGIMRSFLKDEEASIRHTKVIQQPRYDAMVMPPIEPMMRVINLDVQNPNLKQHIKNIHTEDVRRNTKLTPYEQKKHTQVQRPKNSTPIAKEDQMRGQYYQKIDTHNSSNLNQKQQIELSPQLRMLNDENYDYEIQPVNKEKKKTANNLEVDMPQTRLQIPINGAKKNNNHRVNEFIQKQENINSMLQKLLEIKRKDPLPILRSTDESVEVL